MRIVLDTNVLVSAALNPFGPPAEVVRLVLSGEVGLVADERILAEYRDVLSRPRFGIAAQLVEDLLDALRHARVAASPVPWRGGSLPDPDDLPFLEAAVASPGCHLVTGNRRHFPRRSTGSVRVLSPRQFVDLWRGGISRD